MTYNYPDEFKQKVISIFGESEDLKQKLDEGREIIGRLLNDSMYSSNVTAEEIVEACESMNVQGIYQKAKRKIACSELYSEWLNIAHNQEPQIIRL